MAYTDRRAKASFRGMEFLTDSHSARGGRRIVTHEYPHGDVPSSEDLGKKAWDWKLNAYFIGKDYDLELNGLLEKLAEPGATWLTHPWRGLLWVRAKDWSIEENNEQDGSAKVTIEFVEGGETIQPSQDKVDVAIDRTRKMGDAAEEDFDQEAMSADGLNSYIAAVQEKLEVLRQVISLATLPLTWANQIRNLVAGVKGDLATLAGLPDAYANALRGLTNMFGGSSYSDDLSGGDRARLVGRLSKAARPRSTVLSGVAAVDGAVRRNLQKEEALRGRLLVASAAELAITVYETEADRDMALDAVVTAIDSLLPNLPDAVFQAATDARAAVIDALLSQDLKPAVTRDISSSLPAAVLAYRLEVDEDVFLARNAVRHPLFVKGRIYG
ncbi:DNA circularization N-terminal domain-containing protein [Herbaspirillum sp.]|uniref:DNA circularization N-terminal domain-containing protein n=1 Tax=Herbaspirillum sp. TaxID=1890675 RepID=UPI001B27D045|nr:DNA circularization N-terminal domain-containing protein [Herbaspirillum sp.]MBO9538767.1 DNA circularization N-terminal domain-containing protein [Herbaspirillum sp.]